MEADLFLFLREELGTEVEDSSEMRMEEDTGIIHLVYVGGREGRRVKQEIEER